MLNEDETYITLQAPEGSSPHARIYSVKLRKYTKSIEFEGPDIESIRCSQHLIVFCGPGRLVLYSSKDYTPLITISDLWDSPLTALAIFDVHGKSIAYTTSLPIQERDDQDLFFMDPDFQAKTSGGKVIETSQRVVEGMAKFAESGYNLLHHYLSPTDKTIESEMSPSDPQDGVVAIMGSEALVAHWKPHRNPISHLVFNSSGTVVFSCSTKGTSILAWGLEKAFSGGNTGLVPECVGKFCRGFTPTLITHLVISPDDRILSCSTFRGTTHLYNIEKSNSVQQVAIRINSRSSLQVVKSLILRSSQTSESLLSSSPILVKASSSIDQATSIELGYDDLSDTTKNAHMTSILPCSRVKSTFGEENTTMLRYPVISFDPFGKLSFFWIDSPEITAVTPPKLWSMPKLKATSVHELSVGRSSEWQEIAEPRKSLPKEISSWPGQIEIMTSSSKRLLWESRYCTMKSGSKIIKAVLRPVPPSEFESVISEIGINSTYVDTEGFSLINPNPKLPTVKNEDMTRGKSLISILFSNQD